MSKADTARINKFDLTSGGILSKLMLVSLPLIGSQIIQMTYNLTDMFWLGRMGEKSGMAVAVSGSVGLYLWLSMAFVAFGARGAEIGVSQNLGRGEHRTARRLAQSSYTLAAALGVLFAAFLIILNVPLVGVLNLNPEVSKAAQEYMIIVAFGVPFNFISAAAIGIFSGSGNSGLPFKINFIALGLNIILDPILIFTLNLGIKGAAIATVFAQFVSALLLTIALIKNKHRPFDTFWPFVRAFKEDLRLIARWTTPIALESLLFTTLAMVITRLINAYGTDVTAAMRIGSQVESLSWLIGGGFASAMTSFVGQNFGAGKWRRIRRGFHLSFYAMLAWGIAVSFTLYFAGGVLMKFFMPDNELVVNYGVAYLRILAIGQTFQCIEGVAAGAFRGMGKTMPPFIVSASSNFGRVIVAFILAGGTMGLTGIYWALALGSAVRGLWMLIWYIHYSRRLPREDDHLIAMT